MIPSKAIAGALLVTQLALAQHTGYWKQATPQRNENRICRLVEDYTSFTAELRALRWDLSRTPVVNWKDDCVIIIAPSYHYDCCVIAFFGVVWDGEVGEYHLNWGWIDPDKASQTANSITLGSRSPGAEVMVIAFKHGMHASNPFKCSEFQPE